MNERDIAEVSFNNGYEKGCADATPKWIPISEQKPDRDSLVLVFFEGMRDTNCAIQVMYGWCLGGSASHWMPLPEPPKGE